MNLLRFNRPSVSHSIQAEAVDLKSYVASSEHLHGGLSEYEDHGFVEGVGMWRRDLGLRRIERKKPFQRLHLPFKVSHFLPTPPKQMSGVVEITFEFRTSGPNNPPNII